MNKSINQSINEATKPNHAQSNEAKPTDVQPDEPNNAQSECKDNDQR
jgi:hypothetical protein